NGVVEPATYSLAFMTKPPTKDQGPELLRGWFPSGRDRRAFTLLDPTSATFEEIQSWVQELDDSTGGALRFAIQCKSRGWDRLAQALYDNGRQDRVSRNPRAFLHREAWNCWEYRLRLIDTDWPNASRQLNRLIESEPTLATERNKALLKSLDLALVPSKAETGSIESPVDALHDSVRR